MATAGFRNVNNPARLYGNAVQSRYPTTKGVVVQGVFLGSQSSGFEFPIFVFPDQNTEIEDIRIVPSATIPQSPASWWSFNARRQTSSGATRMVSANTPLNTGGTGGALVAYVGGSLGVDVNTFGNTGNVVTLVGTPQGTPGAGIFYAQVFYRVTSKVG